MRQARYVFKINGMVSMTQYAGMSFGRQIEHRHAFEAFKARAKSMHFSCKHKSTRAGVREFLKLYKPAEYFLIDHDGPMYHDDSFEVWYVEKETMLDKSVTELIEASHARMRTSPPCPHGKGLACRICYREHYEREAAK